MTTALNKFLFSVVRDCFTPSEKTLAVAFKQHLILQVNLGKETGLIFQQCISYLGSRLLLCKNILESLAIFSVLNCIFNLYEFVISYLFQKRTEIFGRSRFRQTVRFAFQSFDGNINL